MEPRELCDLLFEALSVRIPRLHRSEVKRWCGLYQESRSRFAYIAHRKKSDSLQVWCGGDVKRLFAREDIDFRKRSGQGPGWEEGFPGRFDIRSREQLDAAVQCLVDEAYPKS